MPNWKKLIVSGSDASLNSLNVTNNVTAQSFTGSFSGSFTAPGATTQIVYNSGGALAADSGLVYSGSRVGIGTTSPGAKLHVASGEIRVDAGQAVTLDTGNVMYLVGASSQLRLYNGGNPIVNITTGGNVGIGTTSPSQVLEVQGQAQIGNDSVTSAGLFIARKNSNQAKSHYFLSAQESPTYQWIEGGYFTSELAGVSVANNSGKPYYEAYSPAGQYKTFGFINQQTSGSSFTSTAATASMVLYQGGNIALAPTQGNVGIGTYSPISKQHNLITSNGSALLLNNSTGGSGAFVDLEFNTYDVTITNYANSAAAIRVIDDGLYSGHITFRTKGAAVNATQNEQMRITSAGNVGIGTTSPSELLEVVGNIRANVSNGGGFMLTGASASGLVRAGATGLALRTNTTDRLTVDNSGNVGIGATSPGALLQVGASNTTTDALIRLGISYDTSRSARGGITWHDGSNTTGKIYTEYDGSQVSMVFGSLYNSGYNSNQLMVIRGNGNVGIGTTSPSQKLDVAGTISVSGSVIDYEVSPGLIGPGPAVNIISFTPGTHYAAFVDYVIKDASTGANQRVGTIQISISLAGAAAVMNEVTTIDIGNTSAITFAVSYGAPTWLTATNSGITPYDINYMVRYF